MTTQQPYAIYADGGVIGRNPSPAGGTWAYCIVDAGDERISGDAGVILPIDAQMVTISNNLTEFYALMRGLEAVPEGWSGFVCSDSQVTLGRIFQGWKLTNLPQWLVARGAAAMKRIEIARCKWVLLDGHPTRAELESGVGKRGHPVSRHNVYCDRRCQEMATKSAEALIAQHSIVVL